MRRAVIALNQVADEGFVLRAAILVVVAIAITLLVYGIIAMIVKMDDVGLHLSERTSAASQKTGRALVAGMPKVLTALSSIGIVAMLWVGGHILLVGVDELGWHAPYELVHHLEEDVHHAVCGVGAALGWLVNTAASAVVGLVVGAMAVTAIQVLPLGHKTGDGPPGRTGSPAEAKGLVVSRTTRRLDDATLKPISASQLTQPKLVNLNPECTKGL